MAAWPPGSPCYVCTTDKDRDKMAEMLVENLGYISLGMYTSCLSNSYVYDEQALNCHSPNIHVNMYVKFGL